YKMQEFANNDVAILEGQRCSGAAHDGCGRMCVLFFKTAWLRKVDSGRPEHPSLAGTDALVTKIKSVTPTGRYICQSTELSRATRPVSRFRMLLKCVREVQSGSRSIPEMLKLIAVPVFRFITRYRIPGFRPYGTLKKTPVSKMNLQPGEWIQV